MRSPSVLSKGISSLILVGALNIGQQAARAASYNWDGGGGTSDLGTAANWSSDTLPDVALGDTAVFDGTVTGPLSLIYSNGAFAGGPGNPGIDLSLASTQTAAVSIDSGANTLSLRLNNITIAAGAGAFSLGNGADVFNVTLGGAPGTHTWTNNSTNTATIASDVVLGLGGGLAHTLALGGSGNWTFNNVLSNGTGTLTVTKSGAGVLTLNGVNTYSGGLTLNAGTLNFNNAAAAGNTATGAITITGGTLDNTSGAAITTTAAKAMAWNGDFTFAGTNNLNTNGGAVTIGGGAGSRTVNVANGILTTGLWNSAAGIGLTKTGTGTLFMSSVANTSNIGGTLDVQAGKVQVAGDVTVAGLTGSGTIENGGGASKWFFVNNAADNSFGGNIIGNSSNTAVHLGLVKSGAGTLTLSGNIGSATNGADTFEVRSGKVVLTSTATVNVGGNNFGTLSVGTTGGQSGVLEINGATVNSMRTGAPMINIGTGAGAQGFVKMTSGSISSGGSTVGEVWVSNNATSFGEFTMSGGTLNAGNWIAVGRSGPGILNISGGAINIATSPYTHGSFTGATGVTNLSGTGIINVNSTGAVGMYLAEAGNGILNMSGGSLNIAVGATNGLNVTQGAGTGIANLNGGIVTTPIVRKNGAGSGTLNFGGGTLRANASSTTYMQGLTAAYINAGGATIDTNNFNITIDQPLLAPTGSGVTAIPVASGGAGYIDAPLVTVSGGSGRGATAVANVSGGVITGFTITNPGVDYAPGDVLTVNLTGGGATTAATVGAVTVGANVGGGLTKTGAGSLTLGGISTYSGATSITAGELRLGASGEINGTSGVTVNGTGAKLVQNSFVPLTAPLTLTKGKLDGTGTLNSVTVGDNTGGVITHGDGTAAPLTINSLTFNGAATLDLSYLGQTASLITSNLITNANGKVTINVTNPAGSWTSGVYNLIGYSTLGGAGFAGFLKGTVADLGARQFATLTNPTGFIALNISGDFPVWTGAQNSDWKTAPVGGFSNWVLKGAGTATDYINGDTVLFDDSATNTTVNISAANVSPISTTFDNSTKNYSIIGNFGIAGGSLIKNGSGSVSLATANTYSGGTTINNGTLNLNNASAIGTGTLTINGGGIDNTSGAAITLSTNNAQTWAGDFTYGGTRDLNLGTGAVTLTASRTVTTNGTANLTVGGVIGGAAFDLTKAGTGTMTLAGANTYTGATNVAAGTLVVTGAINAANAANGGQISVGTGFDNAVMRINGGTVNATKTSAPSVVAGNSDSGAAGLIVVDNGTLAATSELWAAGPANSSGALIVNSGTVSSGSWLVAGRSGNGIIGVNGGSLTVTGQNVTVGALGGSNGDLNLTGGTTATTSTAANQGIVIIGESGTGVLNVSGTASLNASGAAGVQLARTGSGLGYVNLNGGTITTPAVTKGAGSTAIFNFNGGTLRPTAANTAFMTGLTAANVFQGGAKIDTNGQNITVAQPLLAPAGQGVTSIAVADGGTGYIHAPLVRISGGSGTGATGVATITNGVVTGVTITNPGTGYQAGDSLVAILIGGGASMPATVGNISLAANNTTGGLTKLGTGVLTLSGASTYQGATAVNAGTLRLSEGGSVNSSTGITVNGAGAKFVQANATTPVTAPISLVNGTLDGTGTVGSVTVGNGTGGILTNGDGGTGALTIGSLTFSGAGTINVNTAGAVGVAVTGALTTSGAGTVTLNVPVGIPWVTGTTYNLISFGSLNGTAAAFVPGSIAGLGARQTPTPVISGNNVAIAINGDTPVWTGATSGAWTTTPVGTPYNWKLQIAGTGTEFLTNDQVIFDDSATGTTDVTINGANVQPASITFNNSQKNYTVSGTSGIASGLLVKNGTGSVTINTANSYTGGTTVNAGSLTLAGNNAFGTGTIAVNGGTLTLSGANTYTGATTLGENGTLNVNNAGALGSTTLTINGGTLGSTGAAAVTTGNAIAQSWNGDFTFAGPRDLSFNNGAVTIGGTAGQRTVNVSAGTLSTGVITAGPGYGLTKTGSGTLAMTSTANTTTISSLLDVQAGTLRTSGDLFLNGGLSGAGTIENGGAVSKWIYLNNPNDTTFSGTIRDNPGNANARLGFVKRGAGTLNLTGANNQTTDRFAVEDGAVRITGTYTAGYGTGADQTALVGNVANQTASLIVDGGTFNANRTSAPSLSVGTVGDSRGILKMTSGAINAASELWIGSATNSYGALLMSGGTITSASWLPVGRNGNGLAEVSGGTINVNGANYTMGSFGGSIGVTNLSGGSINTTSTAANAGGFIVGEGGIANLNLSGTGAINIAGPRGLHLASGDGTGIANLNGGTVTTPLVQKGNGTGYLNFDGGTLKANAASPSFMQDLTGAYINDGGAVIDDGGFDIAIAQPLLAPTGSGVSSIGFVAGGGYSAAPLVQISGDGYGATAVAKIDASGNLTGFTVTNPGSDYTFATVTLVGGGGTALPDMVGFSPNKSGGLTKKGTGTLTLSGINTYTGATVIESGTLALTGSISGSTAIEARQGATFDVRGLSNGLSLASGQKLQGGGTVSGNVAMSQNSKLSPGDALGTLTFNSNLDLTLGVTPTASAALQFELGNPAASDRVAFTTGGLTIGSGVLGFDDFAFSIAPGISSGTYTLFDGNSPIAGSLDSNNLGGVIGAGFTGTLAVADNGNDLVLTVVPEPGSATMLLAGFGSLVGLRRFRRKSK